MSAITFAQAKSLTLAFLDQWLKSLPASERNMPRIAIYNEATGRTEVYSVATLIAQVQRETPVGKEYINMHTTQLNYVIQG